MWTLKDKDRFNELVVKNATGRSSEEEDKELEVLLGRKREAVYPRSGAEIEEVKRLDEEAQKALQRLRELTGFPKKMEA